MLFWSMLQWPAMIATVIAAWLIASNRPTRRNAGFWCFLGSNILWALWGWHDHAYALVALQICLAAMNIRGMRKTAIAAPPTEAGRQPRRMSQEESAARPKRDPGHDR